MPRVLGGSWAFSYGRRTPRRFHARCLGRWLDACLTLHPSFVKRIVLVQIIKGGSRWQVPRAVSGVEAGRMPHGQHPPDMPRVKLLRARRKSIARCKSHYSAAEPHGNTTSRIQRPLPQTWFKPKPEYGLDWLICSEFARAGSTRGVWGGG